MAVGELLVLSVEIAQQNHISGLYSEQTAG